MPTQKLKMSLNDRKEHVYKDPSFALLFRYFSGLEGRRKFTKKVISRYSSMWEIVFRGTHIHGQANSYHL